MGSQKKKKKKFNVKNIFERKEKKEKIFWKKIEKCPFGRLFRVLKGKLLL